MRLIRYLAVLGASLAGVCAQPAKPVRWDGTALVKGLKIPFTMTLTVNGSDVSAEIVNGEERLPASSAVLKDKALRLGFARPEFVLDATVGAGQLNGTIEPAKITLEAEPYCTCSFEGEAGPDIAGTWAVADRPDWTLTIRRKGDDTFAALRRGSTDIPALNGRFDGLQFLLHYFDGARGALLDITPNRDGSLELTLKEPGEAPQRFRATRAGR